MTRLRIAIQAEDGGTMSADMAHALFNDLAYPFAGKPLPAVETPIGELTILAATLNRVDAVPFAAGPGAYFDWGNPASEWTLTLEVELERPQP